jgi:hypothetical protein
MLRTKLSIILLVVFFIALTSASINKRFEEKNEVTQPKESNFQKAMIRSQQNMPGKNLKRNHKRNYKKKHLSVTVQKEMNPLVTKSTEAVLKKEKAPKAFGFKNMKKQKVQRRNLKATKTQGNKRTFNLDAAKKTAVGYHAVTPSFMSPQLAKLVGGPFASGSSTTISPPQESSLVHDVLHIETSH